MSPLRTLLSWSSGKDSAWCLHVLRNGQTPGAIGEPVEVVGLLTTLNSVADRVAMHAVRRELLEAQAAATGLPLLTAPLPSPCTNEQYETAMREALATARTEWDVTHVAFGDLFLEDVRAYRERQITEAGLTPLFPLWGRPTGKLAREMIESGLRAYVTCVDPRQLPTCLAGRPYDAAFLGELPPNADPCGERGEFHTFVCAGPMFSHPIPVQLGVVVEREGFFFADLLPDRLSSKPPP